MKVSLKRLDLLYRLWANEINSNQMAFNDYLDLAVQLDHVLTRKSKLINELSTRRTKK